LLALENIDNRTVDGRMLRRIKSAMNAGERERHAERFEDLRRWATNAGIWQRRQTPLGYLRDPGTRKLVPDADAERVRDAFQAFVAGEKAVKIATDLGMTPGGVRYLLRNRVYLGELEVGQHVNRAAHPPIVEVGVFEAAQARLDANVRPARGKESGVALLAGLVRCASCGHIMSRTTSKGRSYSYGCATNHSGDRCPAPAAIACQRLDDYVETIALRELARLEVVASEGDQVAEASERMAEAERELEAFVDQFGADTIPNDMFQRQLAKRTAELQEAKGAMRAAAARAPMPGAGSAWPKLTPEDRNTLLRSLLAGIIVRPAGRGRRLPVEDRCRVLRHGAPIALPQKVGGTPMGIAPIPFPDADAVGVLRVEPPEDG
jgi:hypothetical protein